jgi:hypothetical protein
MARVKETKGTVVYNETTDGSLIRTLYLVKEKLGTPYPETVQVVITDVT